MEKVILEEDRCVSEAQVFCEHQQFERLHILFVDGVISSAMLVLENQGVKYVAMLDSTGVSRGYTQAMAASVIKDISGLVVCFSHPKDELIFKKTKLKRIMGPRELFVFWKHVFRSRCKDCSHGKCYLESWSNFEPCGKIPYKSADEIRYFPDDPKNRFIQSLRGCSITIHDMFDGLLARADFVRGGLIFSLCNGKESVQKETSTPCELSGTEEKRLLRVEQMINTLRQMDFSTPDAARCSSETFTSLFKITSSHFYPLKRSSVKRSMGACSRIVPRKL